MISGLPLQPQPRPQQHHPAVQAHHRSGQRRRRVHALRGGAEEAGEVVEHQDVSVQVEDQVVACAVGGRRGAISGGRLVGKDPRKDSRVRCLRTRWDKGQDPEKKVVCEGRRTVRRPKWHCQSGQDGQAIRRWSLDMLLDLETCHEERPLLCHAWAPTARGFNTYVSRLRRTHHMEVDHHPACRPRLPNHPCME